MFGLGAIPGLFLSFTYFFMPLAPSDTLSGSTKSVQKYTEKDKVTGVKILVALIKTQKWGILLSIVLAASLQLTGKKLNEKKLKYES